MSKIVVDKNSLHKFKLTALSPVHIGTGEVYEPTNYMIDNKKLYVFDEVLFYKSLTQQDRIALTSKFDDYMQIIDFYKTHKENAIQLSNFQCDVSNDIEQTYNKQRNKDGSRNTNQLEIQTTFKNPNTHRAIIPGSSIKGMLNTVLQIYPKMIKENSIRQNLIVSDAILVSGGVEIGRADRKHKDPSKNSKKGIYQRIEVIKPKSEFILTIESKFTFEKIKQELKRFHAQRKDSRFKETSNSFVARIGKNEGKNYVVDDGRNVLNNDRKPVATHFLYNSDSLRDEQFGWIKIELISDDEYNQALEIINSKIKNYYNELESRQKELKERLQKEKDDAKAKALEKQKKLEDEQKREAKEREDEKNRLASLSPFELKLEELQKGDKNTPLDTLIFNAVSNGKLDDFKEEALQKLKNLMIAEKKWSEVSKKKNPLKDKNYQRTLKIIEMMQNI